MSKYVRNTKSVGRGARSTNSKELSHSVNDQKIKMRLYEICFKENTRKKTIMDKRSIVLEWIAVIAFSLLIMLVFVTMLILQDAEAPGFYGPTFAVLLLIGFFSMIGSVDSSNRYIEKKHNDLSFLVSNLSINFNTQILFSIHCEAVDDFLKKEGKRDKDQLDYLINFFTDKSESYRKTRWLPFAIVSAFVFPFWNTYVSKITDWTDITSVFLNLLLALTLSIIVFIFRKNIETLILSKSKNYLHIASILRTIKTFPSK
ncbi:hypothetical protein [Paenibacillus sp. O199]|uniref:hypothetical protein n=1 Tax=Paenibacillus sp. O199 TaxID=1643925 RepID=UPI0007BF5036|nr:hypothetical protein [Paenibacillus sp. O199]